MPILDLMAYTQRDSLSNIYPSQKKKKRLLLMLRFLPKPD